MCRGGGREHLALALELGRAIHRARPGRVGLHVRARPAVGAQRRRSVEHVVGRYMQQRSPRLRCGAREVASALRVDRAGEIRLGLGAVDVGPRRAVDARLGCSRSKNALDGRLVGDVELGQIDQHQLVPRALAPPAARRARASRFAPTISSRHRMEMSELSPTMKRYARGWPIGAAHAHVAPQQRGLHAPVEVAHRGAREQDRVLDLGARDRAVLADRRVRADVAVAQLARPRRSPRARARSCAPGAHRLRSPRGHRPASRSARRRGARSGCRGSGGWPRACPPGVPCPSTTRARCAAPRAARHLRDAGSRR